MMTSAEISKCLDTEAGAVSRKRFHLARSNRLCSRAKWIELIEFQAESNIEDPALSPAQKFSRYVDTPTGKELYWASKRAPAAHQVAASLLADDRYGRTLTLEEARALSPAKSSRGRLRGDTAYQAEEDKPYRNPNPPPARTSEAERERAERAYLRSGSAWPSI